MIEEILVVEFIIVCKDVGVVMVGLGDCGVFNLLI